MKFQTYQPCAFGPEATAAIGAAFDAVIKSLPGQPLIVRDIIAARIIEAAVLGERDPIRLREVALPWLTFKELFKE